MSFHKVTPVKKNSKTAPAPKRQAAKKGPQQRANATSARRPVGNKNC
ncbi:hypothetical protein [Streptomyces sp. NPDC048002]